MKRRVLVDLVGACMPRDSCILDHIDTDDLLRIVRDDVVLAAAALEHGDDEAEPAGDAESEGVVSQ